MGHWQERIVFVRDFAFDSPRFRMATNIGDAPATTFAEYVNEPLSTRADMTKMDAPEPESSAESGSESESDALPDGPSQPYSEPNPLMPRPILAHRIHSHRLHVQAKAKSQRARLLSGPSTLR